MSIHMNRASLILRKNGESIPADVLVGAQYNDSELRTKINGIDSNVQSVETTMRQHDERITSLENVEVPTMEEFNAEKQNIVELSNGVENLKDYNSFDVIRASGTFEGRTINGITYTFDGDVCRAKGTATGVNFCNVIVSQNELPKGLVAGKTHRTAFKTTDPNLYLNLLYYKNGVNTSATRITDGVLNIPDGVTGIILRYYVTNGVTIDATAYGRIESNTAIRNDVENAITDIADLRDKGRKYWYAFLDKANAQSARFERDAGNNIWLSWAGNLYTYTVRVVGINNSIVPDLIGSDYYGISPSGVSNAIKIPEQYALVVSVNGASVRFVIKEQTAIDSSTELVLLANRLGNPASGEMVRYSLNGNIGDDEVKCILPSKLRICGGVEMNVYHQNIIRYDNPATYRGVKNTNQFTSSGYYCRYTPSETDAKTFNTGFEFYKYNNLHYDIKGVMGVDVVPKSAGTGLNKKVLFIGDSMTDADKYPQEIVNMFADDPMNVTLLGTLGTETAPNEGRSGWRAYTYCRCANGANDIAGLSYTNPFYNNGHFDFGKYMSDNGYTGVDYVFICLGMNDVAPSRNHHNTDADIYEYWDEMIQSIHAYNPNIKIALWLSPVASFTTNYNRAQFDVTMRIHDLLIRRYDNRESEKIYLCPVYLNVDPYHDYPQAMQAVSRRNTRFTEAIGSDYVHPTIEGYNKCADVIYSLIKYFGSIGG